MAYSLLSPQLMGSGLGLMEQLRPPKSMGLMDMLSGGGAFPPAPSAPTPSYGQRLKSRFSDLLDPSVALPMAGAMIAGESPEQSFGDAFGMAGHGLGELKKARAAQEQENKAMEFLSRKRPDLAEAVQAGMPLSDAWSQALGGGGKATDDMREYNQAVEQGFSGTFMDYQIKMKEAGRNQVNIDTGSKLPTNFRWVDPNNQALGVEPIPGGPGEQMPAELAARIGLAKDALTKLDEVERAATAGDLTGPVDWATGQLGRGDPGRLNRELAAGAEALTRMLTGAGMNIAEAQREASLYLAKAQDDAPTLANKVSQLKRRLAGTVEQAMRGRGGGAPDEGWTDVGNGVRIRKKN